MRHPEKQTMTEVIALLHDQPFVTSLDYIRNVQTLTRRCMHEGINFLRVVLPLIGKRFEQALSGNVAFDVSGLLKKHGRTCHPHFLGSALRRIFNDDGFLVESPCAATIQWLLTVFYYAYKIEVPFSDEQSSENIASFIACDEEIIDADSVSLGFRNRMRHQLEVFSEFKLSTPSFGPGVSSNCKRTEKYIQFVPPSRFRSYFGRNFFFQSGWGLEAEITTIFVCSYFLALFPAASYAIENSFSNSKVLFVPKDARGPRTICCEDSRLMWAQKAIQKSLYSFIESSRRYGGFVNFTDQTINQKLTFDKSYATLDLKEASDRVSNSLVSDIFPSDFVDLLQLCRSPYADLPNGESIELKKFAPMGSALCFPIMALLSYTAITCFLSMKHRRPARSFEVYVYGDDIIVKNEYAFDAIEALESVGLLVNKQKSFINSRFTESCGAYTFDQFNVTPIRKKKYSCKLVYTRKNGKQSIQDNGFIAHYVSLSNSARRAGFHNLANALAEKVDMSLPASLKIPYGIPSSPYLNWNVDEKDVYHFNCASGREVKGKMRVVSVKDDELSISLPPRQKLLRYLLEGGGEKPLNPNKIGARNSYLQIKTVRKFGLSYA